MSTKLLSRKAVHVKKIANSTVFAFLPECNALGLILSVITIAILCLSLFYAL